jgi:hypothetical protein
MLLKIFKRLLSKCKFVNSATICEECSKVLCGYGIHESVTNLYMCVCVEIYTVCWRRQFMIWYSTAEIEKVRLPCLTCEMYVDKGCVCKTAG